MEDFFTKKLNRSGTKRICHEIQIVFKSDADLKEKTLEKAKGEGVTLKAVLTMAMRAYVNDEMVLGMWRREEFYDDKGDSPPAKKKRSKISNIQFPISNKNSNVKNSKF